MDSTQWHVANILMAKGVDGVLILFREEFSIEEVLLPCGMPENGSMRMDMQICRECLQCVPDV